MDANKFCYSFSRFHLIIRAIEVCRDSHWIKIEGKEFHGKEQVEIFEK